MPGSGAAGGPTGAELVVGVGRGGLVLGALAGQLGEGALDLAPDAADGDAEDSLPALQEVDDLLGRGALVHGGAVGEEGDPGQVLDTALPQVIASAKFQAQTATGKLNALITPTTPSGCHVSLSR